MDRMSRPEPRTILMSVVLVAIGSFAGALLDRLSFAHVARLLNTCASSKQFLVEVRIYDGRRSPRTPGLTGAPLEAEPAVEVDGVRLGGISLDGPPIRHFLCEGNHRARIRFVTADNRTEIHEIDFAVARPSLFHLTRSSARTKDPGTCVSDDPCSTPVDMELSAYEPDDPKVRVLPLDAQR